MASGTIEFTQSATSGSYIDGKIVWTSSANNYRNESTVKADIYVRKANTDMTLTIPTEGTWSYTITVDGMKYTKTRSVSVLQSWVLLDGVQTTLKHNADGSKSISISGSITAPTATSFAGHTASGSGTAKFDTIPRATTIDSLTCSSNYVDGTITAKYTPKNSGFYNQRIVYVNVNNTLTHIHTKNLGQIAAGQQTHTLSFDDNELSTIYFKVTNTATAKIRVTFRTYSDSGYKTQIGQDQFLEKDLLIPLAISPTVELNITPVNSSPWLTQKNIYVAGLSGATAVSSAAPGEGAKLTSNGITYDNVTYSYAGDKEVYTLNIPTLKKSGNIGVSAKVIDSRGRTATAPKSITVFPYSAPAIASMQVERGTYKDGGWVAADDGPDVRAIFKTTLSLTDQDNTYSVAFKVDGADKLTNHGETTGLKSGAECSVYFVALDGEVSRTLTMTATDSVGSTGTAKLTIPTIHITIEFNDSGKGIAFGKTSEKDAFECAWDAEFGGSASIAGSLSVGGKEVDIIVDQGTSAMNHTANGVTTRSGTWTYRKWSSGILECWGVANVDVNINMTWAEPYYYGVISTVNYPIAFTELPVCNVSVAYGDDSKSLFIASCARGTNVYARGIMLCRNTKETVNCDLHYHAIGRWK